MTRQNVEYYRARAAGGAALIVVEITFMDDEGSRAFHAQLGAHNDNATNLKSAVSGLDVSSFLFSSPDLTAITTFDGMKRLGVMHNLIKEGAATLSC